MYNLYKYIATGYFIRSLCTPAVLCNYPIMQQQHSA